MSVPEKTDVNGAECKYRSHRDLLVDTGSTRVEQPLHELVLSCGAMVQVCFKDGLAQEAAIV